MMLDFYDLLVGQACYCFGKSLRKWSMAPIAGMIDCCPACAITVLNIGSMFKEDSAMVVKPARLAMTSGV